MKFCFSFIFLNNDETPPPRQGSSPTAPKGWSVGIVKQSKLQVSNHQQFNRKLSKSHCISSDHPPWAFHCLRFCYLYYSVNCFCRGAAWTLTAPFLFFPRLVTKGFLRFLRKLYFTKDKNINFFTKLTFFLILENPLGFDQLKTIPVLVPLLI